MNGSIRYPSEALDEDLDGAYLADDQLADDDYAEPPCAKSAARPVRSRRDLERYMEERALEKELDSWWQ